MKAELAAARLAEAVSLLLLMGSIWQFSVGEGSNEDGGTQVAVSGSWEFLALPHTPSMSRPVRGGWDFMPAPEAERNQEETAMAELEALPHRIRVLGEVRRLEDALYVFYDLQSKDWFQLAEGAEESGHRFVLRTSATGDGPELYDEITGQSVPLFRDGKLCSEIQLLKEQP